MYEEKKRDEQMSDGFGGVNIRQKCDGRELITSMEEEY